MILLLVACAGGPPPIYDVKGEGPSWATLRRDGVAIAPVQVVKDLPAPPLPPQPPPGEIEDGLAIADLPPPTQLDPVRDAAFLRNDYVGNVRFGGGYLRTGDVALEVRARLMEFGQEDVYLQQATRWLAESVGDALAARGVEARPLAAFPVVEPVRAPFRGVHEDDGHDNLNLPRVRVAPAPVEPAALDGAAWVLVPFLRAYYTHNGGWFIGQKYGCLGGARVEVMLALYEGESGRPVWWMEATGRHIQPMNGQPTRAELDQYLLWAEDQVEGALARGLLR
ncbi:MAG: hypothetical protein ACOZNI_17910 [Myxococcota bacterium]